MSARYGDDVCRSCLPAMQGLQVKLDEVKEQIETLSNSGPGNVPPTVRQAHRERIIDLQGQRTGIGKAMVVLRTTCNAQHGGNHEFDEFDGKVVTIRDPRPGEVLP